MFSPSFQDSFFVSQKTSSICNKYWGNSCALGTIYCLKCIKELFISFLSTKDDFISLFAQPEVLHVSEPSLDCLIYIWITSLTRFACLNRQSYWICLILLCKVCFGSWGWGNHYYVPTAQTAMHGEHDKAQQKSWSSTASGLAPDVWYVYIH